MNAFADEWAELGRVWEEMSASGNVEVRKDGEWLAELPRYTVTYGAKANLSWSTCGPTSEPYAPRGAGERAQRESDSSASSTFWKFQTGTARVFAEGLSAFRRTRHSGTSARDLGASSPRIVPTLQSLAGSSSISVSSQRSGAIFNETDTSPVSSWIQTAHGFSGGASTAVRFHYRQIIEISFARNTNHSDWTK